MTGGRVVTLCLAQAEDGGVYECQVSTTPVMGHHVTLRVAGNLVYSSRVEIGKQY